MRHDELRRTRALPRGRIALEIADDLIAYPILTVADAQSRYGRTNQANRDAVNSLVGEFWERSPLDQIGTIHRIRMFTMREQ